MSSEAVPVVLSWGRVQKRFCLGEEIRSSSLGFVLGMSSEAVPVLLFCVGNQKELP